MPKCMRCGKPMVGVHNAYNCLECGTAVLHDPLNNFYMDTILSQAEIALGMLCEDSRAPKEFEVLKQLCAEDKFSNMEELMQFLVPIIFMAGVRKGHT